MIKKTNNITNPKNNVDLLNWQQVIQDEADSLQYIAAVQNFMEVWITNSDPYMYFVLCKNLRKLFFYSVKLHKIVHLGVGVGFGNCSKFMKFVAGDI